MSIPISGKHANRDIKKKIIGIFLGHQVKLKVNRAGRKITALNHILKSVSIEEVRSYCFNSKSARIFPLMRV